MKIVHFIISVLIFSWCVGYIGFVYVGSNDQIENNTFSDTIIILGNNKQNMQVGSQLIKLGYAPAAFITGDKKAAEYNELLKENNITPDQFIFATNVKYLGINDAKQAALFIKENEFISARIIAHAYQVRRASIEIEANLMHNTNIIHHGVAPKEIDYTELFAEYNKFLLVFLANLIGMADEINLSYS